MIAIMERAMTTAKVFTTGRSQAVRLPKEFRFKGREVRIWQVGDMVCLCGLGKERELFEDALRSFTPDFMEERRQPTGRDRRRRW